MPKQECKKIDNIILKLTETQSRIFAIKNITHSLQNIANVFFKDQHDQAILREIQKCVPNLSDTDIHFLFFALLNVDILLKDQLCALEATENMPKMVRFFQDLQKLFVQFLTSSEHSNYWLVSEC